LLDVGDALAPAAGELVAPEALEDGVTLGVMLGVTLGVVELMLPPDGAGGAELAGLGRQVGDADAAGPVSGLCECALVPPDPLTLPAWPVPVPLGFRELTLLGKRLFWAAIDA
jgi:hypothetical protein